MNIDVKNTRTIDGVEPVYLDAPNVWLKEVPSDKIPALGQQEIGNI